MTFLMEPGMLPSPCPVRFPDMRPEAAEKATGKTLASWFSLLDGKNAGELSHKEIASLLQGEYDVSEWWSQTITVEYEKHIGRRVLGETADGLFQLGVSRTCNAGAEELWDSICSSDFFAGITGENNISVIHETLSGSTKDGLEYGITTFVPPSRLRMKYKLPEWDTHSILQIRITPKTEKKSTVSFHQEKLPSRESREMLKQQWAGLLSSLP